MTQTSIFISPHMMMQSTKHKQPKRVVRRKIWAKILNLTQNALQMLQVWMQVGVFRFF